jgi:hypothetical protein
MIRFIIGSAFIGVGKILIWLGLIPAFIGVAIKHNLELATWIINDGIEWVSHIKETIKFYSSK